MWMVFTASLLGALLLTPLARAFAARLRVVDRPDGNRKLQKQPIPLFGGVAVYLAVVLGLIVMRYGPVPVDAETREFSAVLIAAAGFVCLFGCLDDTWNLSARFKLLLQAASVLPIVLGGYSIDRVLASGYPVYLGWLGVPLTVLWLVACINALNLLDGMDGLAGVVGLSTSAMLAIIAAGLGSDHVSLAAIALAGALAGFLVYNLPPASIYLGDSGSMVIGLIVGLLAMQSALKTPATLSITAPALVLTIPMLDTLLAIVRRKLSGQRIAVGDRGHIHHRLLERGLSNWQALGIIGVLCLLTGGSATAAIYLGSDGLAWAAAVSVVVLLVRLRVFGHYELSLAKLSIAAGLTRLVRLVFLPVRGRAPPPELAAASFEAAWRTLIEEAKQWPAHSLEIVVGQSGQRVARYEWHNTLGSELELARQWSFAMTFGHPERAYCQLRATGHDAHAFEPWYLLRVARIIKAFGEYWAGRPEDLFPTVLSIAERAPTLRPEAMPPRSEAA